MISSQAKTPKVQIRSLRSSDRDFIEQMLKKTGFFSAEETTIALELCDTALHTPDQKDYYFGIAEIEDKVAGYACFGLRPLTDGSYDLYWICVDPAFQKAGVGKILMAWAEDEIRRLGGRLVIAETSGRSQYHPTRAFYLKLNYKEEARIKDFYKEGDDMVIYTKHLKKPA